MSNLLTLLQPKDYKSKIKLYCRDREIDIIKVKQTTRPERLNEVRIKRIKIESYENT